jgi:hypothetical protein
VAVFVDESAEHVDPFDTPEVLDTGGCWFRLRDGVSRSMPRCGRAAL